MLYSDISKTVSPGTGIGAGWVRQTPQSNESLENPGGYTLSVCGLHDHRELTHVVSF